eukprot:8146111-Pyramimonas_sp.AAC.1
MPAGMPGHPPEPVGPFHQPLPGSTATPEPPVPAPPFSVTGKGVGEDKGKAARGSDPCPTSPTVPMGATQQRRLFPNTQQTRDQLDFLLSTQGYEYMQKLRAADAAQEATAMAANGVHGPAAADGALAATTGVGAGTSAAGGAAAGAS